MKKNMKTSNNLDELKLEKKSWEESLKIRTTMYKAIISSVKDTEYVLKKAKSAKYQAQKKVKEAKMRIKKLDLKIHSLPSRLRSWTKKNPGKALSVVMGEK
jgi:hypothetical protein